MKRLLAILTVLAVGLTLLVASPASASPPTGCTSGWSAWSSAGWGRTRWCYAEDFDFGDLYWQFQVQDTQTDGYVVHLEACSDYARIYYPHSCTDVSGNYNPFFGLIVGDASQDLCPQSSGEIHTTQFPSMVTKDRNYSFQESYLVLRLVRGRCEGGPYQNVNHSDNVLQLGP